MLDDNKHVYVRTISQSNTSISINLPHKLCKMLDIKRNSVVKIEADEDEQVIVIKKIDIEDL